jgi:hypothetical protein
MKDQTRQILIHVIACLGFLSLAFIPFFQGKSDMLFNPLAGREFLGYALLIPIFYFNYFILVPKLYFAKRYFFYGISIVVVYLAYRSVGNFLMVKNDFLRRPPNAEFQHRATPPPHIEGRNTPPPPPHGGQQIDIFIDVNQKIFPFLVIIVFSLMLRVSSRWRQRHKSTPIFCSIPSIISTRWQS